MAALRITHTSSVTDEQIDHLGHMNVRYYAVNAHAGTRALLSSLASWGDRAHVVHDLYTRHHREQLLGTALVVRSAVLGANADGIRLHHELAAADTEVLAATFVHRVSPVDDRGHRLPVPDEVVAEADGLAVEAPPYAAPRTVSLEADLVATAPSLETLVERELAMRKERRVTADECDDHGDYRLEMAPMLTWGGESLDGQRGDELLETVDGELMGWATMESRVQFGPVLPRIGTRIQAFGACIALHDKVMQQLFWTYDLDTGDLLTGFEVVSLAFDVRGRRAMAIPDRFRRRESARVHPDLAPQAPA